MDQEPRAQRPADADGPGRRAAESLERALGGLFEGAVPPPAVGEALRRAAQARAARRRLRVVVGAAALAAAAGLVALAVPRWLAEPRTEFGRTFDLADVDRSGRVDVWDAYLLARAIEVGDAEASLDLDGDGAVTRADADFVAQRAVEVPR